MKWSVTLTDPLGPEILTVLEIEGEVLHRVRLHLKVLGWLSNLNALLTKKLPKFLSRLNEMSGGRENTCLVSGSLRRINREKIGGPLPRKHTRRRKSINQHRCVQTSHAPF